MDAIVWTQGNVAPGGVGCSMRQDLAMTLKWWVSLIEAVDSSQESATTEGGRSQLNMVLGARGISTSIYQEELISLRLMGSD